MEKNNYLRPKDAAAFLGIGKSTLWAWHKGGKLPKGVLLSARCRVWSIEELEGFVARQKEATAHE